VGARERLKATHPHDVRKRIACFNTPKAHNLKEVCHYPKVWSKVRFISRFEAFIKLDASQSEFIYFWEQEKE
jgi:hypothetical protein